MRLRFLTAGESHGPALTGIIEGLPSGLELEAGHINHALRERQRGHGRGGRMKIETDTARILSGVRWGRTLGGPITIEIENRDWENWQDGMSAEGKDAGSIRAVTAPRPGHADLSGALKYNQRDIRNILERSSARETAMRVALGAVASRFLTEFGITTGSFVTRIGDVEIDEHKATTPLRLRALKEIAGASEVRCPDEQAGRRMIEAIDRATLSGDSLGGVFEVFILGLPTGLGSHVQWDRRLDGRLAQAIMSIQAIKGVEIGMGFEAAGRPGSEVMDVIEGDGPPWGRATNNAGGIEGGMSNGMPIIVRGAMKPIPTQKRPLMTVDILSRQAVEAAYERSDVCAVPAAAVIGEAMASLIVADAFLEKFGGDSMAECTRNFDSYTEALRNF